MRMLTCLFFAACLIPSRFCRAEDTPAPPRTVAEKSDYKATSRHADVVAFCEQLAKLSPAARHETFGTSAEGRKLPLLVLADPPVSTPAEAARQKKTVVLAFGNIHAGEVDGKEALLMLARDIATGKDKKLLKELVILVVPILNADGNEKLSKDNRPSQNGPEKVGTRANAQGFDLNRDFVKLETPEVRALVRLIDRWSPAMVIDTHTTNGSRHRYTLTYDGPRHPAANDKLIAAVRDTILPDIDQRFEKNTDYRSFFYGNFSRDRKRWQTYPALPRYGIQYFGLRNQIGILSESYSYAPYKDRVLASRAFVKSCLEYVAENRDTVRALLDEAHKSATEAGRNPRPSDEIALRFRTAARKELVTVLGFEEEEKDGKRIATDRPKDYRLEHIDRCEPTLSVRRPYAYLFPASLTNVVENLQRHGIEVEELREDIELDVEAYRIDKVGRGLTPFQKHHLVTVEATPRKQTRRLPAGTILVRTGQPLGTLAAYLLEPQAEDGLTAWNFFDDALKEGRDFPVLRLPKPAPITSGPVRPLREKDAKKKPITVKALLADKLPDFSGTPVSGLEWLDDGEHFLQVKQKKLYKVHALTGRATLVVDPDKLAKSLATIPGINRRKARELSRRRPRMNPERSAALFDHQNDLYLCKFDGGKAVRLTSSPPAEELASFSPDGKLVAFVRANNLYVVDVATQKERQLTTDGGDVIFNGKADWVYFEEIFGRNRRAYWWSPDSSSIAFLRFDDTPLKEFTVIDQIPLHQKVERTPYPKAGDPNPLVKLGIVSAAGGPVRWAASGDYSATASLISRVGWFPDSRQVYYYVQDRAQTWLDFCTVGCDGGEPKALFREKTKAWVEELGEPTFLKDGSLLVASERSGWKHLYHFTKDGKLIKQVTDGPWEMRELHLVDEENNWLYFTGTRDSHLAEDLYRVRLDGTSLTRLTNHNGWHRVAVSPKGNYFINTWSDRKTPAKVQLCRADGSPARTLDTNPVYALEEYEIVWPEPVRVKADDGFVLEGTVLLPPDLDTGRKYPVWFKTYGGPHAPTMRDAWPRSFAEDQALARAGFIIFRADPRSASGKGACSAWTAYRQLGVPELADVETLIRWISKRPYVDKSRIGMSGHSYGGFLTAYCLTHSKLFAAGIAGAPVTDWRNYDTIYTERYMNTPQENPKGYDKTSVVKAAKDLHGRLLITHGLMDDNVHFQNTAQLIHELQKANKDFEMMVYPRSRHGLASRHYRRLLIDFMRRSLKPQL